MPFDIANRTKPVLKWAGGKSSLLPQLVSYFPKNFNKYIEPFLGGGAVFLALKNEDRAVIINDCNEDIFNLYLVIRDEPHEFMAATDLIANQYSESFYYFIRAHPSSESIQKAAQTLFLNKTGFNGLYRLNSQGKFNVPFGKRSHCPALYEKNNLLAVSQRLKKATLTNLDFEHILDESGHGDFVYCDPPYEPLSPTSSFNTYNSGGFSMKDQMRLYQACLRAVERGAQVAVSNSTNPSILNLYKEWDIQRIWAKRSLNSQGKGRGPIEEVLILMNQL